MKQPHLNTTYSMHPAVDDLLGQLKTATGIGKSAFVERVLVLALSGKSKLVNELIAKLSKKIPTAAELNKLNDRAKKVLKELE